MFLLRGDAPRKAMFEDDPNVLRRTVMRIGAPLFIREIPFEESFFRPKAERFLGAVETPVMLLGGLTRRDSMVDAIDAGFAFVAIGRALLREPDLVNRYATERASTSRCIPCNLCIAKVGYQPTRCVRRPDEATVAEHH